LKFWKWWIKIFSWWNSWPI